MCVCVWVCAGLFPPKSLRYSRAWERMETYVPNYHKVTHTGVTWRRLSSAIDCVQQQKKKNERKVHEFSSTTCRLTATRVGSNVEKWLSDRSSDDAVVTTTTRSLEGFSGEARLAYDWMSYHRHHHRPVVVVLRS